MTDLLQPPVAPSWRDHLAAWRAWCTPVRLILAVAGLALAAVGVMLLLRPATAPAPLVLPRAGTDADSPAATPAAGSVGAPGGPLAVVTVHAAGAVANPGVYALPDGARVADVVTVAGGRAPDSDVDRLNLAARVADGERVYVPRRGEEFPPAVVGNGGVSSPSPGQPGSGVAAGPIDLNVATAEQLDTLPGVGPATSSAIITYRERNGRFRSVDELLEVPGIGPAKLEAIRSLVRT